MPVMTTVITPQSFNGTKVVYTVPGHTVQKPFQLEHSYLVASGGQSLARSYLRVKRGVAAVDGSVLPERAQVDLNVALPVKAAADTEIDAMIAFLREVVASDNFVEAVKAQMHLHLADGV